MEHHMLPYRHGLASLVDPGPPLWWTLAAPPVDPGPLPDLRYPLWWTPGSLVDPRPSSGGPVDLSGGPRATSLVDPGLFLVNPRPAPLVDPGPPLWRNVGKKPNKNT